MKMKDTTLTSLCFSLIIYLFFSVFNFCFQLTCSKIIINSKKRKKEREWKIERGKEYKINNFS
jgi:hypothetical protein